MVCDAGIPQEMAERLWDDPFSLLENGDRLHTKRRSLVALVNHGSLRFVLKYQHRGNLLRRLKKSLSATPAGRSWHYGHVLRRANLPTPRPRALVEVRWGPFTDCCFLLTDWVDGTPLYRLMRFGSPTGAETQYIAQQLAAIWQRLDELRICHNDLKTENLLVDRQSRLWLIDLEGMRRYQRVDKLRERQARDVNSLLHRRNWRADPGAAELFRNAIAQTPAATVWLNRSPLNSHPLRQSVPRTNRASELVTVLIPCRNAEATLWDCLRSVRDMADEILVADAGSTDHTVDVARKVGGCRIVHHPTEDHVAFERWAVKQARHQWILRILPSERLTPALGRAIQDLLAQDPNEDGFRIPRAQSLSGKPSTFGRLHTQRSVRLFRKNAVRLQTRHGRLDVSVVSLRIGHIRSPLQFEPSPAATPARRRPAA